MLVKLWRIDSGGRKNEGHPAGPSTGCAASDRPIPDNDIVAVLFTMSAARAFRIGFGRRRKLAVVAREPPPGQVFTKSRDRGVGARSGEGCRAQTQRTTGGWSAVRVLAGAPPLAPSGRSERCASVARRRNFCRRDSCPLLFLVSDPAFRKKFYKTACARERAALLLEPMAPPDYTPFIPISRSAIGPPGPRSSVHDRRHARRNIVVHAGKIANEHRATSVAREGGVDERTASAALEMVCGLPSGSISGQWACWLPSHPADGSKHHGQAALAGTYPHRKKEKKWKALWSAPSAWIDHHWCGQQQTRRQRSTVSSRTGSRRYFDITCCRRLHAQPKRNEQSALHETRR